MFSPVIRLLRYMKREILGTQSARMILRSVRFVLLFFAIFVSNHIGAITYGTDKGWTPTDAGLYVNLENGNQIMVSVMIDANHDGVQEEYFLCATSSNIGTMYPANPKYGNSRYIKLTKQADGAIEPAPITVWTIDTAITRIKDGKDYSLGGPSYTMWSSEHYTLATDASEWKFYGNVSNDQNDRKLCDVVFAVPTVRGVNMDPNGTLNLGDRNVGDGTMGTTEGAFDGKTGVGFGGMVYREVYMFVRPKTNQPITYTNSALVTIDSVKGKPDFAFYGWSNGLQKWYETVPRTIFRLYIVKGHAFETCPNSYFFSHDEQNYVRYRNTDEGVSRHNSSDSTAYKKTYSVDHLHGMTRQGESTIHKTDWFQLHSTDSTYYYIGRNNKFCNSGEATKLDPTGTATSQFMRISTLRIDALKDAATAYYADHDAYGRVVVDTTSTADNLDATFEPKGYFLKVSTGKNVRMVQTGANEWTTEEMWTINEQWVGLQIKATTYTGEEFDEDDPGADIIGWSQMVDGTSILTTSGDPVAGKSGWARIYTDRAATNGGMVFIVGDKDRCIHYDNNGHFGAQIPNQHPLQGNTTVTVQAPRLIEGYQFEGWAAEPNGPVVIFPADSTSKTYRVGQEINLISLPDGLSLVNDSVLYLYAKARYTGTINVALSFINESDGKRYFLTNPNDQAPRFARARHFDDWTNVWQGMSDAGNSDPKYMSSFNLIGHDEGCIECNTGEYVLSPHREVMHGVEDSLEFYDQFEPEDHEYIGLYYTDPNTILANNTWAGLFKSSAGWPTPAHACVASTQISSTHYLDGWPSPVYKERSNSSAPYVKYNGTQNQFDGVASAGTNFMISGVGVVDAHYVVLPDTTRAWTQEIEFDFHEDQQSTEAVWAPLIGKQLLAQMKVGDDTIYFHPNRDKIYTTGNELRLSSDFHLTETFNYIRDSRVESLGTVNDEYKPTLAATSNEWCYNVVSGYSSPIDVEYQGQYIDIVDTLRIILNQSNNSRIKEYYGRWNDDAPGLHKRSKNVRYRDILVRTKTYHYGPEQSRLTLKAELNRYSFDPMAGTSQQLNFSVTRQRYRNLLDAEGNFIREEETGVDDLTEQMAMWQDGVGSMRLASGEDFTIDSWLDQHVIISTKALNKEVNNLDTLIITKVKIDGVEKAVSLRIPLVQTSLFGDELIWSVTDSKGQRYFITAGKNAGGDSCLIFRKYKYDDKTSILYKEGTSTQLIKGSKDAANSDKQYITPWTWTYDEDDASRLTLKTEYGVDQYFYIADETTPQTSRSKSSYLSYRYVGINSNENGNQEEVVRLKYGPNKWLKFNVEAGVPSLTLVEDSASGSIFSWGYLEQEYSLLNNGTYPSKNSVEFGYNAGGSVQIQTCYKGYKEYSMLLGNKMTYLCRQNENSIAKLVSSEEWRTDTTITLIPDGRVATSSGITRTTNRSTLTTSITPTGESPMDVKIGNRYVNIVDTLAFSISLQSNAPAYRFKDAWKNFNSIEDTEVKIPIVRKTYHAAHFDSLVCRIQDDDYEFAFPPTLGAAANDDLHTYNLKTERRVGEHILDVNNVTITSEATSTNVTTSGGMDLSNVLLSEVRLVDAYGKKPNWCKIEAIGDSSITVRCLQNGIRAPRSAYAYCAYIVTIDEVQRFVNFKLTVSQTSLFNYANNQTLVHTAGASGDSLVDGMQQVHENKRILYYYPEQDVELPIRERGFYGWWRWYREGDDAKGQDVSDSDIPDSLWRLRPRNTDKFPFPFRTIGDSVWVYTNNEKTDSVKQLITMGRYTVFHKPSSDYGSKQDPPSKSPRVAPPDLEFGTSHPTLTYVVDLSNYTDNLPVKITDVNAIDTALLDTIREIIEPTLSLREVFELHPWTEMADTMEHYKYADNTATGTGSYMRPYMEDHVVMAPIGTKLLLSTNQRYNRTNLEKGGHSESLLGYYMRDDNWKTGGWDAARKDSMIWCVGWDATADWYVYNPIKGTYTKSGYTITQSDDFLEVPARTSITSGYDTDTLYYCLRARSKKTTTAGTPGSPDPATPDNGENWFNICRYTVIYHDTTTYGPLIEKSREGEMKAIITKDEIEQHYEVLERLDFDYNKPGSEYTTYPHPLPWADASYGYCYPETGELPHNRYHSQSDFANFGEYGIINRIPYSDYWHTIEQHGGAANGYMIYCDGMSSAGQVAALHLETDLCQGQRLYFSGYVGNPSSQSGKANPNFLFSVQGSYDDTEWMDITSYLTGDVQPSNKWSQIYFPIDTKEQYNYFRVRIFNMASTFDGNDFIIDDMCIFATKPQLIAYQANTSCVEQGQNDSLTNVIVRVDYQGFNDEAYNNKDMHYTVEQTNTRNKDTVYVVLEDHYINEHIKVSDDPKEPDIYGHIHTPARNYEPVDEDSIYANVTDLVLRADTTPSIKQGYVYEEVEDMVRPVMYIIHKAKMTPDYIYKVRMAVAVNELKSSICAMTSNLKVSNRMLLELNGQEQPDKEIVGMCANTTYDISLRVKGSLFLDSVAPIDLNGSCVNDWLLYGDTVESTSLARYGYKYSDIKTMVTEILRCEPMNTTNANQFAANLGAVSRNEMLRLQRELHIDFSDNEIDPYTMLTHLVNKGYLTLYKSKVTATVTSGDSVQYMIMPIIGTGSDAIHEANVEVCPTPIFIKLKPDATGGVPLMVGGLDRGETQSSAPVVILADETTANQEISLRIDSIMNNVVLDSIVLMSTDDEEMANSGHLLMLQPDRTYDFGGGDNSGYYRKGDDIHMTVIDNGNPFRMRAGYNYTFKITLQTNTGSPTISGSDCRVGSTPFTLSVVPNYLRWDPKSAENSDWNDANNWIGITQTNAPIHENAHFVPLSTSNVVIPTMTEDKPYPTLPDPSALSTEDSVKQVGFEYNTCASIRFMSGTAIDQPQRLNYTKAIVDMGLPQNQWALRSAPVKGMLSGDIFMSNADLNWGTSPWEVGSFDASGRNATTGNAAYWLSMYSQSSVHQGNTGTASDTVTAEASWSRVTNGMTLPLQPAQGWAVYTKTKSGNNANVRLPKNDDVYYYYTPSGEKSGYYENKLREKRDEAAGEGETGKLAFHPDGNHENYSLVNGAASKQFVFGNPTMGYIDIWGFIADNELKEEISYLVPYTATSSEYITVTKESLGEDVITNLDRYLPPMHAIVVSLPDEEAATTTRSIQLNTNRVVTKPSQVVRAGAPRRRSPGIQKSQGIMTVTAINPVSTRCTSRLLLGQGFHNEILEGEDALLSTINIDNYSTTNAPATPFNIYASEGGYGLSIDLKDSIVNVPISFYMSDLPYDPVTHLWFTGVNNLDGQLVLYDAQTGSERNIVDGGCLKIETPEQSHQTRYYIRRYGYTPDNPQNDPIPTGNERIDDNDQAVKFIKNGHVLILRNGHVYTIFGQKIQ